MIRSCFYGYVSKQGRSVLTANRVLMWTMLELLQQRLVRLGSLGRPWGHHPGRISDLLPLRVSRLDRPLPMRPLTRARCITARRRRRMGNQPYYGQ